MLVIFAALPSEAAFYYTQCSVSVCLSVGHNHKSLRSHLGWLVGWAQGTGFHLGKGPFCGGGGFPLHSIMMVIE